MKLPPHMKIALTAYVRSDHKNVGADIAIGGCVDTETFSAALVEGFTNAACGALNAALEVTDARAMTPAEVLVYQAEKEKDLRSAGRVSESHRLGTDVHELDGRVPPGIATVL